MGLTDKLVMAFGDLTDGDPMQSFDSNNLIAASASPTGPRTKPEHGFGVVVSSASKAMCGGAYEAKGGITRSIF